MSDVKFTGFSVHFCGEVQNRRILQMQFVTNGPDIPDALLQAHEEGRVVFFCGAGISAPAGLPLFQKLGSSD